MTQRDTLAGGWHAVWPYCKNERRDRSKSRDWLSFSCRALSGLLRYLLSGINEPLIILLRIIPSRCVLCSAAVVAELVHCAIIAIVCFQNLEENPYYLLLAVLYIYSPWAKINIHYMRHKCMCSITLGGGPKLVHCIGDYCPFPVLGKISTGLKILHRQ